MEIIPFQGYPWDIMLHQSMLMHHSQIPTNYVHWRETPESHIYSADLPGVRKEEIKVEVEDSMYLIIRTEVENHTSTNEAPKRFMRKFRLPRRIDIDGISAGYVNGVLKVTVPRLPFFVNLAHFAGRMNITTATAA
ncbi:hypothetical protein RND81_10G011700 [Saponaria officinalis]|uniref:SHSP domain-containing protein n=1 Tax=Saponaria officinalis TaxID=3572 RepID=A0AAW1HZD7_SAPOF